jgi:hypothetical protein
MRRKPKTATTATLSPEELAAWSRAVVIENPSAQNPDGFYIYVCYNGASSAEKGVRLDSEIMPYIRAAVERYKRIVAKFPLQHRGHPARKIGICKRCGCDVLQVRWGKLESSPAQTQICTRCEPDGPGLLNWPKGK